MIYGSTPLAYIIVQNHLESYENAKVNLSAVFFTALWLIILSIPFLFRLPFKCSE